MWKLAAALTLTAPQRADLETFVRSGKTPQWVVTRAMIVLAAADGTPVNAIARELGIRRPTVYLWRDRFPAASIIGLSHAVVHRIWRAHGLQPHRIETFKLSRDPDFVTKLRDVVGVYLNPPAKALVFCVDEKPQVQALDRTELVLPLRPGIPARQTHDYIRHGTTSLFAALNVLDGTVLAHCAPRKRHTEFVAFLNQLDRTIPRRREVHLILDNYATHTHPTSRRGSRPVPAITATSCRRVPRGST